MRSTPSAHSLLAAWTLKQQLISLRTSRLTGKCQLSSSSQPARARCHLVGVEDGLKSVLLCLGQLDLEGCCILLQVLDPLGSCRGEAGQIKQCTASRRVPVANIAHVATQHHRRPMLSGVTPEEEVNHVCLSVIAWVGLSTWGMPLLRHIAQPAYSGWLQPPWTWLFARHLCNIQETAIPQQEGGSAMQAAPSSVMFSPGMGKMSSPLECTQASASCPGVQPFSSAISFTFSTSLKFCRDTSNVAHSGAGRTPLPCLRPVALACGLRPSIMAVQHLSPIFAANAVQCREVYT